MCGILVTHGVNRPFSHRSLRSLRKRGPDQIGFWADSWVQMAHARLAIIGLDDRGSEPLENDTHVLAFNGEIYNYNEIRSKLQAGGLAIRGGNDAEVLLHAWSAWGSKVLTELNGFWAFVVYDKAARRLTLVRDQYGVKPLYFSYTENGLCVASTIRTIQEMLPGALDLDYTALSEYVRYQFTFGDKTFFKQVKKVMPGHTVEIDLRTGNIKTRCYEDILTPEAGADHTATAAWMDECRELIAECVTDSTVGDTPFTTLCSGGIDSSLITRLASPEMAYHCNYSDPECNETFYAQQVVNGTSTRLFVVNATESFDLVSRLQNILEDFDEMTVGSVILPLDDLLSQVRRRYKVLLIGTGGDELFAGYVRYQLAMGECHQESYRALFQKMRAMPTLADRFEMTHRKGDPSFYRFYDASVAETFKDAFSSSMARANPLQAMLQFDRRYFLSALLNIDDKMCGRHGLEGRPSLLHQKLVRHINQLDPAALLSGGELKPLLRAIASSVLPKPVIQRADKMGFTTPIGTFVNHSSHLIREQITGSRFNDLYDLRRLNLTAETKFSREVFGLLMLDLWLNRYARTEPRAVEEPVAVAVPGQVTASAPAVWIS
jgi:asparagine synthase (glutamine-hydrolysing)